MSFAPGSPVTTEAPPSVQAAALAAQAKAALAEVSNKSPNKRTYDQVSGETNKYLEELKDWADTREHLDPRA